MALNRQGDLAEEIANLRREKDIVQGQLDLYRSSLRFRLGDLLVNGLSKPKSLMSLPLQLWKLLRTARQQRQWQQLLINLESGLPNDPLRNTSPGVGAVGDVRRVLTATKSRTLLREHVQDPACVLAESRLRELISILDSTATLGGPQPHSYQAAHSKHVALILHTILPLTDNGYTQRSDRIIAALSNLGWKVSPFVRADLREARLLQNHETVVPICRPEDGISLKQYIEDYAAALESELRLRQPTIVHAASNFVTGLAASKAAARLNLPFIYEVRGFWEQTRSSLEPTFDGSIGFEVQQKLEQLCCQQANLCFGNGEQLAETILAMGVDKERIHIVPNGVDIGARPSPEDIASIRQDLQLGDEPTIAFAGTLTSYEGLDDLIEAASLITQSFRLLIIGDGPERHRLATLGEKLGDRLVMPGRLSRQKVRLAYWAADIVPVVRKPLSVTNLVPPLKPAEAMEACCALVVSDLVVFRELINNNLAIPTPAGDPRALAVVLSELLQKPERRHQMAARGRQWAVKNRSWDEIAQQMVYRYEALTA